MRRAPFSTGAPVCYALFSVDGRKPGALLKAANAPLQLADEDAMANDRSMIFHYRAAKAGNLLAGLLLLYAKFHPQRN